MRNFNNMLESVRPEAVRLGAAFANSIMSLQYSGHFEHLNIPANPTLLDDIVLQDKIQKDMIKIMNIKDGGVA